MNLFKNPLKGDDAPARPRRPAPVQPIPKPEIKPALRPAQMHDASAPPRNAESVFIAATDLSALLAKENMALRTYDTATVAQLAEHKEALVRLYNDQMAALAANPAVLMDVTPERKAEMAIVAAELKERIDSNASLLKGNLDAANRVMKAFVDAARDQRTKAAPYGRSGAVPIDYKNGQPTALAYNKNI